MPPATRKGAEPPRRAPDVIPRGSSAPGVRARDATAARGHGGLVPSAAACHPAPAMARIPPLSIPQYKDLLTRIVATYDNLTAAEAAGDASNVDKLRSGLRRLLERAREAGADDA